MSFILVLDTAGAITSVSLIKDGVVLASRKEKEPNKAAELLAVFTDEIIKEAKINFSDIKAIALSKGPGSYTGLRISTSYAKGLCFALSIPLISYSTLQGMAFSFLKSNRIEKENIVIPMIDARREEAYFGMFDSHGKSLQNENNIIAHENIWQELGEKKVYYFGNGAEKFKKYLPQNNFNFIDNFEMKSDTISEFLNQKYIKKEFENLAYFEPNYIKEFHFTTKIKENI